MTIRAFDLIAVPRLAPGDTLFIPPALAKALASAAALVLAAPKTGARRIDAERALGEVLVAINRAPFLFRGPLNGNPDDLHWEGPGLEPYALSCLLKYDPTGVHWALGGLEEWSNGIVGRVVWIDETDPTRAVILNIDGRDPGYHAAVASLDAEGRREAGGWSYANADETAAHDLDIAIAHLRGY